MTEATITARRLILVQNRRCCLSVSFREDDDTIFGEDVVACVDLDFCALDFPFDDVVLRCLGDMVVLCCIDAKADE